ncbi:MAG: hypothetical protein ACFFKA_19040 [Candidatus Thorarchaeota archaeon]
MPYIIVTIWYPTDAVKVVTERYFDMLRKYPFDKTLGKETIPVAVTTGKTGIKAISIMESKRETLGEALTWAGKRMVMFQDLKGVEYKIRVWSNITEALEAVGISAPK